MKLESEKKAALEAAGDGATEAKGSPARNHRTRASAMMNAVDAVFLETHAEAELEVADRLEIELPPGTTYPLPSSGEIGSGDFDCADESIEIASPVQPTALDAPLAEPIVMAVPPPEGDIVEGTGAEEGSAGSDAALAEDLR